MSNKLEVKIKDLIPAPELKDSAEYPISQEGVTYKVNHAQIEGKIVNKLGNRFVSVDQKGAANGIVPLDENKKIPNENLTFGEVKEGDENVVSGGEVFNSIKNFTSDIEPINLSTEKPTNNGVFEPIEVGVYTNFGGLELTQEEKNSSTVYFYLLDGVFSKQVKKGEPFYFTNKKQNTLGKQAISINSGGGMPRKPIVSITFDDGYMNDYTLCKPLLDRYGVKSTFYLNIRDTGYDGAKLTATEIKEMYNEGHEFGSHTETHSALYNLAINKSLEIGNATIEVINGGSIPQFKPLESGSKYYLKESGSSVEHVITCNGYNLANGVLTMNLSSPSVIKVNKPANIYMHEDTILREVLAPKEMLNGLEIPCYGIATPWGEINDRALRIVNSNFAYSRNASASTFKTNGGIIDRTDDLQVEQFKLYSSEIVTLTSEKMDELINECFDKKALLIVLGHTNGWGNLEPKLELFIQKVIAKGIEIMPLHKALEYHGNAINANNFVVGKNGETSVTTMPLNHFSASTAITSYKLGKTIMRFDSSNRVGMPNGVNAGIIETTKSRQISEGGWWYQMVFDNSTNNVWYRKGLTATTARDWALLNGGSGGTASGVTILPRNTITDCNRIDLLPLGLSYMRIDGNDNVSNKPAIYGTLETIKTLDAGYGGWTIQKFYEKNKSNIWIRTSNSFDTASNTGVFTTWELLSSSTIATIESAGVVKKAKTIDASPTLEDLIESLKVAGILE